MRRIEFTSQFLSDDDRIIRWVYVDDVKTLEIELDYPNPETNMGTPQGLKNVLKDINPTDEEIEYLLSLDRWGDYPKHGKGSEEF